MKLIVLSDTHMPKKAKQLPDRLIEELKDADLIIHAGDWQTVEVYHELKKHAPVRGVYGNVDGEDIKRLFPSQLVFDAEGHKIGVIHGHGEKKTTEKRVIEAFEKEDVSLIIFGHSHLPLLRYYKNKLLFNPGSVTDKRKLPYYSFGKLTVSEEIQAEHIFFKTTEE
ncbi:metallophosphoesterase family protein [Halobacillus yeomjeoni]|uniref:Phosphoesterase n=1 Tax=Halobacillus yeomjeoni TaxID=311194 RepID=A0A931MVC9_9BACI|nr:metallophosphoesterase family protein [Halobacillus yeomjeoni]MBH0230251.1 metallophosphoesterase family protein [Halobacillus yeomjeoni]